MLSLIFESKLSCGYLYSVNFIVGFYKPDCRSASVENGSMISVKSPLTLPIAGFIRRGKVKGKSVLFTYFREWQGKSGKPAMVKGK